MPVKKVSELDTNGASGRAKNFGSVFLSYSWRIGLTIALLYVVFRQVDPAELWSRLLQTSWWALAIFMVGELLLAYLAAIRWALLTVPSPSGQQIGAFFRATMLGLFYNLFMPSSMGGDLVKWTALTSLGLSKSKLVFTMLLDRLMGLFGLVVIGFLGVLAVQLWGVASIPTSVMWLFVGLFAGVAGLFGFVYSPLQLSHFPLINRVSQLLRIESYLETHKRAFMEAFGLGLVMQLLWLVLIYVLAVAVGFQTSWWQFFVIQPVVSAVTTLPISFAGFGATEAGFMYFYSQLGESGSAIVALTSLLGVFRILIGLVGWGVGMVEKK